MKKTLTLLTAALALIAVFGTKAEALAIGDAWYLGSINDGIPASPANEVIYINTLTTLAAGQGDTQIPAVTGEIYNRQGSGLLGPFPVATISGAVKDDTNPSTTVDITGYTYILGKYDAAQAGSLVWLVSGLSGTVTLPPTYNGLGLSHWSLYNPIVTPDGGSTAALLGTVLVGFGMLRRRFGRA